MLKNYNPDVLSCLANLSNDEVFTPPELANAMLDTLPKELWQDENATFLDPCCKSGVFLREIAKRLIAGLKDKIPDEQERINHICTKQLFGISITAMTGMLSRRSVYCSKHANGKYSMCTEFYDESGNIIFNETKHTFKNGKCTFCGAAEAEYGEKARKDLESHAYQFIHTLNAEEIFNMRFDVIIGNPPYQLSTSKLNKTQAVPIYDKFVNAAIKLKPQYVVMIIPSRWFAGGMGMDNFRDMMLNCRHISKMVDYSNAKDCFPGVSISGGINYFVYDSNYQGNCEFTNIHNELSITDNRNLAEFDCFIRYNEGINVIRKIKELSTENIVDLFTSLDPFRINSNERGHLARYNSTDVVLYSSQGKSYLHDNEFTDRYNLLDKYKVMISKVAAEHANEPDKTGKYKVLTTVKTILPNEVCTFSYFCCGTFNNLNQATYLEKYLKTNFTRFLVMLALSSINITKDKFQFVPMQNFTDNSDIIWRQPITEIDKQLYRKYKLSQEEIDFIESMIRPME